LFDNRLLRISGQKATRRWINCIKVTFIFELFAKYYGHQITAYDMGGAHEGERCDAMTKCKSKNPKGRDNLRDLNVDGNIFVRCMK
jgi:hypothetical protein